MKNVDKLLVLLKEGGSTYVSGEKISKDLGITRAAVWKEVQALKALGYGIRAVSHLGYRLCSVPDKLFADEIQYGLRTKKVGKRIFSYEELGSTNSAAARLGEDGFSEGVCVFAEHQKKGRGRLGRVWSSPRGQGILVSVLLRPNLTPSEISRLTLMAALAVIRAIEAVTGLRPGVKWPNDVVHDGKKLCGILTEMSGETDRVRYVVVGIGLNVNALAKDLPPKSTSLRQILGEKISRVALARRLLEEIENHYFRLGKGRFEDVSEEWENFSETTGQRVLVKTPGRTIHGRAAGVDTDGALWIRHDSGLRERVLSGDVERLRSERVSQRKSK
jgi:BirA family biotin operon repressor/biotin-[acetyl-CoA-carboxylase] ligase